MSAGRSSGGEGREGLGAGHAGGLFIAGTDTGVGKTRVTVGILRALAAAGRDACGMKPVASGAERVCGPDGGGAALIAEDTREIAACCPGIPLADITPYAFEPPISPHIAASRAGICIDIDRIAAAYGRLRLRGGVVVVEGTGGWMAPIRADQTMADIAVRLGLPVVLVVGLRLGCLNHALLSAAAIRRCGLPLAGWIGNAIDPVFEAAAQNIDTLARWLGAPPLAVLPHAAGGAAPAALHSVLALNALGTLSL